MFANMLNLISFCEQLQNFKHIMKELQGAIIVGAAFQAFLGYSGLMSWLVRYDAKLSLFSLAILAIIVLIELMACWLC